MTAIFTNFSPSPTIQMTIGQSRVTLWFQLPAPWPVIIGCYVGNTIEGLQALASGATMEGQFNSTDGAFTWQLQPSGTGVAWQLVATPTGGVSNLQTDVF